METALRFDDLHRRLKLLAGLKNRASMLHLLHALSGTGLVTTAAHRHGDATGIAHMPPRVFTEPSAGLSGIGHLGTVGQGSVGGTTAPAGAAGYDGEVSNGQALGGGERLHGESMGVQDGRHRPGSTRPMARRTTEVTERTLLKGILYAFQVWKWYRWVCWVVGPQAPFVIAVCTEKERRGCTVAS